MKVGIRDIRAIAKNEKSFARYWQERQKQRERRKEKREQQNEQHAIPDGNRSGSN